MNEKEEEQFSFTGTTKNISQYSDGLILIKENDNAHYYDKNGNLVLAFDDTEYNYSKFTDGVAKIAKTIEQEGKKTYKYGLIDKTGTIIVQPQYDRISMLNSELFLTKNYDQYGLINIKGEEILDTAYTNYTSDFEEGYMIFYNDNTWYIINENGEIVF